jgi:hypothetical protein
MTFWRKEHGLEEFEEIARIVIGDTKDRTEYKSYQSPMYHLKYPVQVLGLESNLIQWRKDAFEKNDHWKRGEFDIKTESGKQLWMEYYVIEKLNTYLNYNIRWVNGKSAKQQFNAAKDIYHYFKKEAEFE